MYIIRASFRLVTRRGQNKCIVKISFVRGRGIILQAVYIIQGTVYVYFKETLLFFDKELCLVNCTV